jgi:hypothetical protein
MQHNLVRIRGQCRGRPPNGATNRDGPDCSWQLAVGSWQLMVSGRQSAVGGQRSDVRGSPYALRLKRRRRRYLHSTVTHRLQVYDLGQMVHGLRLVHPHARDWISVTCSVKPRNITQDRNKDRSHTTVEPAESSGVGEVCPGGNVEF